MFSPKKRRKKVLMLRMRTGSSQKKKKKQIEVLVTISSHFIVKAEQRIQFWSNLKTYLRLKQLFGIFMWKNYS